MRFNWKQIAVSGMVAGMVMVTGCAGNVPANNHGNYNGERLTRAVERNTGYNERNHARRNVGSADLSRNQGTTRDGNVIARNHSTRTPLEVRPMATNGTHTNGNHTVNHQVNRTHGTPTRRVYQDPRTRNASMPAPRYYQTRRNPAQQATPGSGHGAATRYHVNTRGQVVPNPTMQTTPNPTRTNTVAPRVHNARTATPSQNVTRPTATRTHRTSNALRSPANRRFVENGGVRAPGLRTTADRNAERAAARSNRRHAEDRNRERNRDRNYERNNEQNTPTNGIAPHSAGMPLNTAPAGVMK